MASYANDTSEKYIPEKVLKGAILIKTPRPKNLDPLKKTRQLPAGASEIDKKATRYCCR